MNREIIDTHQHLWVMSEREYSWIEPEYGILYGDFTPEMLALQFAPAGVTGSVLVQAADTYDDTFYMLDVADRFDIVKGVVGYVPFERTAEAITALELFVKNPYFKGVRNLTHDYSNNRYGSDPHWITSPAVLETLKVVAEMDLSLDYVAVNPDHLANIPILAEKIPTLKIVVDHFAKPDIAGQKLEPWARQMSEAALYPNVYGKLSGLNTVSTPGKWNIEDWQPYVDHMITNYGGNRIMLGGDWPVCLLANSYQEVWQAQIDVLAKYSETDQEAIRFETAISFYNL